MRITNNMITANTKSNIGSNKVLVDKYNTQMTTQKKINKPSENPVIAIRSLRMQTTLSHLDQYLDNNIEDADAWLNTTDTALNNMSTILTDIYRQCVYGATDTLKQDDRRTILNQLTSMADQIYDEGNTDYAERYIFTGYRTNSQLTFKQDEKDTTYNIDQSFTYKDLAEHRYYFGEATVPADANTACTTEIGTNTYERIRLAYDDTDSLDKLNYTYSDGTTTTLKMVAPKQNPAADEVIVYDSEDAWYDATKTATDGKTVTENQIIFIKGTGELILGKDIAHTLRQNEASIDLSYTKTGFEEGEARPEYYYNCKMKTPDMADAVEYTKEEQKINFVISTGIEFPANTEASEVLDTSIGRDIGELIDIVQTAIDAHDKVDKIEQMMQQEQYSEEKYQKVLQGYLDAANKEADYADDNLQKTFSQYETNFQGYLSKVSLAHSNVGCLQKRLELTKTRVENQRDNVEDLKTENDNREISDIIMDYTAAYNAYTASLTAASKVEKQTLLDYI